MQRFDFHAIGNADIQARLTHICDREGFGYDPEALELVVRHARGGMRDAISELEQLSVSVVARSRSMSPGMFWERWRHPPSSDVACHGQS